MRMCKQGRGRIWKEKERDGKWVVAKEDGKEDGERGGVVEG